MSSQILLPTVSMYTVVPETALPFVDTFHLSLTKR
jgi:hypothetical protein